MNAIKNLCHATGFDGYFTNHSLRTTTATCLFEANVDGQLMKLKTGQSSDGVRSYKRVNERQLSTLTNIITGTPAKCAVPTTTSATISPAAAAAKASLSVSSVGCSLKAQLHDGIFHGIVNINVNNSQIMSTDLLFTRDCDMDL